MAIKGSLKEASLPDVLQLLAMGKKTGCLSVTHRSNFGSIYFDKGKISYASIVNRRDRLGDILVKSGLLSAERLDEALVVGRHGLDVHLLPAGRLDVVVQRHAQLAAIVPVLHLDAALFAIDAQALIDDVHGCPERGMDYADRAIRELSTQN